MAGGILFLGSLSFLLANPVAAEEPSETRSEQSPAPKPPRHLRLTADRQRFDVRRNVTIAEGDVRLQLGSGQLAADRVEFDGNFQTVFARGSVRLSRTGQVFQASALRYNLNQNEGELDDVYGVIDLDAMQGIFQVAEPSSAQQLSPDDKLKTAVQEPAPMACPPLLPPVPDWHPQPWAVTAWGGQMIDAAFGDTFLFNGTMRPEAVLGIGLQKRILRAGPLALELEADLFSHLAKQQPGGEFNQDKPYADLPAQSFGEGIVGIGARLWVQPWLSFSVVEGISYNTDYSLYEKTFRENYTKLLNYLGFEVEAAVSSDVSLVGRIHHRSGAFGTYSGVTEGSNAYLLGLRYRWGRDLPEPVGTSMVPPLGCPDPERSQRVNPTSLSERLESIALGDGGEAIQHIPPSQAPTASPLSAAEQQRRRSQAIADIDQQKTRRPGAGGGQVRRRGSHREVRAKIGSQRRRRAP